MLLFILFALHHACNNTQLFQNIVCYCLSENIENAYNWIVGFQNIVCYCLSQAPPNVFFALIPFQNIVCYCLSCLLLFYSTPPFISKHRMLLFIQFFRTVPLPHGEISKHRMLLFISVYTMYLFQ